MNWVVLILGIFVYGCNADFLQDVAKGNAEFTANVYKVSLYCFKLNKFLTYALFNIIYCSRCLRWIEK